MPATLAQLSISNGGMPKHPVLFAHVGRHGVEGDKQRNLKYHGGPDRAVCLFSEELYAWLRNEHGIELQAGSVGENFTTRGVDLDALNVGEQLRVGECLIELTDIREPCRQLNQWHPNLRKMMKGHSGWVARIIEEGTVYPGDEISVTRAARPCAK